MAEYPEENKRKRNLIEADAEIGHSSIVLGGRFNPAIFHPSWFDHHGVVREGIAEAAEIGSIDANRATMTLGDVLVLVEPEIFELRTETIPEIRLLDIASKIFGELLPQTNIGNFSINRFVHFSAKSTEKRVEIFRELAPHEFWSSIGNKISPERGKMSGGLISITMREILDDNDSYGHMDVLVEPSAILPKTTGIFVSANRYFDLMHVTVKDGAAKAISKLQIAFANAFECCDEAIYHFIGKAN